MVRITLALCALLALAPKLAPAQTSNPIRPKAGPVAVSSSILPESVSSELAAMAAHASVIFTGQVVAIDRQDTAGFVDIRFRILESVRNAPTSGTYTLREWAGLWSAHPDRYRVGQRRLMLLTARGPVGFSAPVAGSNGAIPLIATAQPPLLNSAGIPTPDNAATPTLAADLRWVQARTLRASATPAAQAHTAAPVTDSAIAIAPLTTSPIQPTSLATILAVLQSAKPGANDARF